MNVGKFLTSSLATNFKMIRFKHKVRWPDEVKVREPPAGLGEGMLV